MDELPVKMSKLFDKGFDLNGQLKETNESSNDISFQTKVLEAIRALEESTRLVNELSLFSSNESVEEIATKNMKYLLLPAILADMTLMSQSSERSEVLKTAEIYFHDFIQRLNDYQICDIDIKRTDSSADKDTDGLPSTSLTSRPSLDSAVFGRNDKIKRYKESKEMDDRLKEMRQKFGDTDDDTDDEILRDYYQTLIKRWIHHSLEELSAIESEKPMLEHMKQMRALNKDQRNGGKPAGKLTTTSRPLKPIIITRNEMQKTVYGLGYPSIPTVTVDDFISQKVEEGSLAITNPNIYNNNLIDWAENPDQKLKEDMIEEERKEILIERDDLEALRRARDKDDWKDDHKRGEGNRKNMG